MSINSLQAAVEKALLKLYISDTYDEIAVEEYAMNKKEKILKTHTSSVCPIKKTKKGESK